MDGRSVGEEFLDESNDHCERLNFMMIMKGIVEEGRTKNLKSLKNDHVQLILGFRIDPNLSFPLYSIQLAQPTRSLSPPMSSSYSPHSHSSRKKNKV